MKSIGWLFLTLILLIGCTEDPVTTDVALVDDMPHFFLHGSLNGELLDFAADVETDFPFAGGIYYNEKDIDGYQIGFRRNQENLGPWYADFLDTYESISLYFPPPFTGNAAAPDFNYLKSPGKYAFSSPRPGTQPTFKAHVKYTGHGWYLVSPPQRMDMRWNFGNNWLPYFSWSSQDGIYTEPRDYPDYTNKNIQLEVADTDGTTLQYNQFQFDFADESKNLSLHLRPYEDSLYASIQGTPPYTYQWNDGSTGPGIVPQGTGKQEYCVTVTDGYGKSSRACATYFFSEDGTELEKVYAGSGVYGVNKEIVLNSANPRGIAIKYISPEGRIYYSQLHTQPSSSHFEIKEAKYFQRRGSCIDLPCPEYYVDAYALSIRFSCTLFSPDGSSIQLDDAEALLPYFPVGE
jgi:hypothetical protein